MADSLGDLQHYDGPISRWRQMSDSRVDLGSPCSFSLDEEDPMEGDMIISK